MTSSEGVDEDFFESKSGKKRSLTDEGKKKLFDTPLVPHIQGGASSNTSTKRTVMQHATSSHEDTDERIPYNQRNPLMSNQLNLATKQLSVGSNPSSRSSADANPFYSRTQVYSNSQALYHPGKEATPIADEASAQDFT